MANFNIDHQNKGATMQVVGTLPMNPATGQPYSPTDRQIVEAAGLSRVVSVNPALTAASAYASGQSLGGLLSFAGMARVAGAGGLVQNVALTSLSGQMPEVDLVLFNDLPTGSTITDRTAVAIAAADLGKIAGYAKLKDYIQLGTPTLSVAAQQAISYRLASGTTLYAVAITRSAVTFTSGTGLTITLGGPLD